MQGFKPPKYICWNGAAHTKIWLRGFIYPEAQNNGVNLNRDDGEFQGYIFRRHYFAFSGRQI